jgi:hypothetical protein
MVWWCFSLSIAFKYSNSLCHHVTLLKWSVGVCHYVQHSNCRLVFVITYNNQMFCWCMLSGYNIQMDLLHFSLNTAFILSVGVFHLVQHSNSQLVFVNRLEHSNDQYLFVIKIHYSNDQLVFSLRTAFKWSVVICHYVQHSNDQLLFVITNIIQMNSCCMPLQQGIKCSLSVCHYVQH